MWERSLSPAAYTHSGDDECQNSPKKTIPATSLIPDMQNIFGATFLEQADTAILTAIDEALRAIHPRYEPNLNWLTKLLRISKVAVLPLLPL
ncbi:MAG TPA: hypothetical protein VFZ58_04910 [Candidatus Saccharimonadales bacterium]